MPKVCVCLKGREGLCLQKLQPQGDFFFFKQQQQKNLFGYFAGNKSYSQCNTEQTLL